MAWITKLRDFPFTALDAKKATADAIWLKKEDSFMNAQKEIRDAVERGNYSVVLSCIPNDHVEHVIEKLKDAGFEYEIMVAGSVVSTIYVSWGK